MHLDWPSAVVIVAAIIGFIGVLVQQSNRNAPDASKTCLAHSMIETKIENLEDGIHRIEQNVQLLVEKLIRTPNGTQSSGR